MIKDVKRMTRVDVTYNTVPQRRHTLAYEGGLSSAGRSRIASITECAGSTGTDCFAPTTFTYQNGTPGLAAESGSGAPCPPSRTRWMSTATAGSIWCIPRAQPPAPGTGW